MCVCVTERGGSHGCTGHEQEMESFEESVHTLFLHTMCVMEEMESFEESVHTLFLHTMCVMECEIERGLNLAMSLSLRLCLVASFSRSLIISRHLKSRICCTGDIIPA